MTGSSHHMGKGSVACRKAKRASRKAKLNAKRNIRCAHELRKSSPRSRVKSGKHSQPRTLHELCGLPNPTYAEIGTPIPPKPSVPSTKVTLVDTTRLVQDMVDYIMALDEPAIYMDLEGRDLDRTGEICTLQLCLDNDQGVEAYLVDVWVLQNLAFHTPGRTYHNTTFKSILEDPVIPKLFWDCRMDSDALYAEFGIALEAVIDIQLMEVAKRGRFQSKSRLRGYAQCVGYDLCLSSARSRKMRETKEFQAKFIPDKGGDWNVLKARPMAEELKEYCVGDIEYMPRLLRTYGAKLMDKDYSNGYGTPADEMKWATPFAVEVPADLINSPPGEWAQKVVEESRKRVLRSWGKGWDRTAPGQSMTVSPWPDPWMC